MTKPKPTTPPPQFGTANKPQLKLVPMNRLIGPKQLPEKGINYNLNHLRRMWAKGDFPVPIHTSARRIAWPEAVLDAWINEKIAAG
jgi:hypothetical protein